MSAEPAVHEKTVKAQEARIIRSLAGTSIMPQHTLTDLKLVTKRYPMTLAQYIESVDATCEEDIEDVAAAVDRRLRELHALGILHGDAHTSNIVVDPETLDVRLIDFGESVFLEDADEETVEYFNGFWAQTLKPCTRVEQLTAQEFKVWRADYWPE